MSPNRRIFLNIVATYGRSLCALLCGLFTSRWVLMALGVEAYGVFGVVGVVITICTTINYMISGSVSRFYAYAFGQSRIAENRDVSLEECRGWFNVALFLHVIFSLLFLCVGVFCGEWAINNYFNIPFCFRKTACWVLYFLIINMVVSMLTAPFSAMYIAQQYIAELTIYGILKPIFNVLCAWWLLHYQGDRLWFYACYTMIIAAVPNLIIMCRALVVFPECRITLNKMVDVEKIKRFFSFAGWQFVGLLGLTIRTQGASVLTNKLLGVNFNSTMAVASTVTGHVSSLSSALNGAFTPAITNAAGAHDYNLLYKLSLRSSKFGTLLLAVFATPLLVELEYVIQLWLKNPPPLIVPMCMLMLLDAILYQVSIGALVAINAVGNVKWHELLCFVLHGITIMICYAICTYTSLGILGIGVGLVLGSMLLSTMRMVLWKKQLRLPIREWFVCFIIPFVLATAISFSVGRTITMLLNQGIMRLILASLVTVFVFCISCMLIVLDSAERRLVCNKLLKLHRNSERA